MYYPLSISASTAFFVLCEAFYAILKNKKLMESKFVLRAREISVRINVQ